MTCRCVHSLVNKFLNPRMTDLITTPETFWNSLREQLLEVIPADTFRVWFDNMRIGRLDDDGCELIAPKIASWAAHTPEHCTITLYMHFTTLYNAIHTASSLSRALA